MTIDMSQFYQVFFEETAEHLKTMESLLVDIDVAAPSLDDLNAIFRAAHSIKGGAATFGFNDMTEVTHILESLLDRLRKEELPLRTEMIDEFLKAGDILKAQLNAHQNGGTVEQSVISEVCRKLDALAKKTAEQVAIETPVNTSSATDTAPTKKHYHIEFTVEPEINLDNLFAELSGLGNLKIIQNGAALSPSLWQIELSTYADSAELLDTIAYFTKPDQVDIQLQPQSSEDESYGFFTYSETADSDPGYGFFTHIETPQDTPAENTSYGFFTEITPAQVTPDEDAGYGFFTDIEEIKAQPAQTPPPTTTASQVQTTPAATPTADTSIRVNIDKVDQLINLVGELVITQAMLAQAASTVDPVIYENLMTGMAQLERNTRDLQESVMSIRMLPINFVFSRFPRLVRDLASKLNKQIELKTIGEDTELDKVLIEKLADPLTHLVRNSLDHGIELPEKRIAAGKDPKGTITLRAFHQGGSIIIEVSDDGSGLHRDKILDKAKERGLSVTDNMPDQDVWQLIFAPGFSTAEEVTDVSGRGVGMDVVKRNIQEMGGRVEIQSEAGWGSKITIRLPLTLAILDGMSIGVGKEVFIIPLAFISESLQPAPADIKTVTGEGQVVQVRGEYLPLIALHKLFNMRPKVTEPSQGILVLLEAEGKRVALFVDELLGQHQVVIKSLETNFRKVPHVSGATIMGDGRVAVILDVASLVTTSTQNKD
ncbi:chemotaxis protein CheW [Sulfurirhabdus autotrophica]|uniref:Chemotaxis protein CheA n=1 Tax=Sulfurirhabdus autotrophica TaxID=1706046 RepID=A0A4R3XWB6_9PROT|nr:chemotaxis protein CheW [Sulfurirhabdus autotrophica]TCV83302.1 two-component system chemotaxis sensor kinase CheA [Sulfurirhabdus autotrophica]